MVATALKQAKKKKILVVRCHNSGAVSLENSIRLKEISLRPLLTYRGTEEISCSCGQNTGMTLRKALVYEDSILVMIYKPESLSKCLRKKSNAKFLEEYGYKTEMSLEECLEHLRRRYTCGCPHELGIFLGYPVKDVISFMENQGQKFLMCRYWKVYHNPDRAMCIFKAYDRAKNKMISNILAAYRNQQDGISINY